MKKKPLYYVIRVPIARCHSKSNYFGQTDNPLPLVGCFLQAAPITSYGKAKTILKWLRRPGNDEALWGGAQIQPVHKSVLRENIREWLFNSHGIIV